MAAPYSVARSSYMAGTAGNLGAVNMGGGGNALLGVAGKAGKALPYVGMGLGLATGDRAMVAESAMSAFIPYMGPLLLGKSLLGMFGFGDESHVAELPPYEEALQQEKTALAQVRASEEAAARIVKPAAATNVGPSMAGGIQEMMGKPIPGFGGATIERGRVPSTSGPAGVDLMARYPYYPGQKPNEYGRYSLPDEPIYNAIRDATQGKGLPRDYMAKYGNVWPPGEPVAAKPNATGEPKAATAGADLVDEAAAAEEARRKRLARGRSATLLTGAGGVLGAASTAKKTLLGA